MAVLIHILSKDLTATIFRVSWSNHFTATVSLPLWVICKLGKHCLNYVAVAFKIVMLNVYVIECLCYVHRSCYYILLYFHNAVAVTSSVSCQFIISITAL